MKKTELRSLVYVYYFYIANRIFFVFTLISDGRVTMIRIRMFPLLILNIVVFCLKGKFLHFFFESQLPYEPLCPSVGLSVSWLVCLIKFSKRAGSYTSMPTFAHVKTINYARKDFGFTLTSEFKFFL